MIRNLSKSANVEAEIILRNFMMERFLERISISKYKDNFILKGGMLIAAMVGIDTRTTMDMDATIKGQTLQLEEIVQIIEEILSIPLDDGAVFTLGNIEEIREEADYPGFRVSVGAVLDRTRQTLKIDITTGDFITPREVVYNFKLMFEDRVIRIMAYNLETVLAEKIETIITRGVTNTRMRDFYDIYILTATQTYNAEVFVEALKKTIEKRGTAASFLNVSDIINVVSASSVMFDLWKRYQKKFSYAEDISWEKVIDALKSLAEKIY